MGNSTARTACHGCECDWGRLMHPGGADCRCAARVSGWVRTKPKTAPPHSVQQLREEIDHRPHGSKHLQLGKRCQKTCPRHRNATNDPRAIHRQRASRDKVQAKQKTRFPNFSTCSFHASHARAAAATRQSGGFSTLCQYTQREHISAGVFFVLCCSAVVESTKSPTT